MKRCLKIVLIGLVCCGFGSARADESLQTQGAALTLKVVSFDAARVGALSLAQKSAGTLAESRTFVVEKGRKHGYLRLTFPVEQLPMALDGLRKLGVVCGERLTTGEHRAEVDELARRAERLRGHQTRLTSLLANTRRLRGSDILYVQERLVRAETDEDLLTLHQAKLRRAAGLSRITVELYEPVVLPFELRHPKRAWLIENAPRLLGWAMLGLVVLFMALKLRRFLARGRRLA